MKYLLWFIALFGAMGANAQVMPPSASQDLFWEWVGLIALAVVGVVILFVSSEQLRRLKKVYDQILEKEKKLEESQSKFLEDLGENIYETLQATAQNTDRVIEKAREVVSENEIEKIKEGESRLLNTTQDLVFFLKLKSKRVEIHSAEFDLYRLLQDIEEILSRKYGELGHTFEVEIEEGTARILEGDSLRLGQALVNLLENAVEEVEKPAHLQIVVESDQGEGNRVDIKITLRDLNEENVHPAFGDFEPYYDDERREFVGLKVYVARELLTLMGGELGNTKEGGSHEVILKVPLHLKEGNTSPYAALPEPCREVKNALIYEASSEEAEHLAEGLKAYGIPVTTYDLQHCNNALPNFALCDLAIIGKEMLLPSVRTVLRALRSENDLTVVLLIERQNAPEEAKDPLIDHYLFRPFTQRDLFNLASKVCGGEEKEAEGASREESEKTQEGISLKGLEAPRTDALHIPESEEVGNRATSPVNDSSAEPLFVPPLSSRITRESFTPFEGRILLAEDNEINQKIIADLLAQSHIELDTVSNGDEALRRVKNHHYDLVILDNHMPVMDGEDVAKAVRENPTLRNLPLVIFTASSLKEKGEEYYREIGFDAFLPKPFNISQLYTLLEHFLSPARPAAGTTHGKENLPVLDTEQGLAYANNQADLYAELLKEFLAVYSGSGTILKKYQSQGSLDQARNLLLDVRGLAATIGAESLFRVADALFRRLEEKHENLTTDDVARYEQELAKLRQAAERYLLELHV